MPFLMTFCISILSRSVLLTATSASTFKDNSNLCQNLRLLIIFNNYVKPSQLCTHFPSSIETLSLKTSYDMRYFLDYEGCGQIMWFRMECSSRLQLEDNFLRNSSLFMPLGIDWRRIWWECWYLDNRNHPLWDVLQVKSL